MFTVPIVANGIKPYPATGVNSFAPVGNEFPRDVYEKDTIGVGCSIQDGRHRLFDRSGNSCIRKTHTPVQNSGNSSLQLTT